MSTPEAWAALAGAGIGLGAVLVIAALTPTDRGRSTARRTVRIAIAWPRVGRAVGIGFAVGWWTGWPVAALLAGCGAWWLPGLLGPDREHEAGVAKIEAVAGWAEQLRDTLAGASGLEQAIITTARTAPAVVRPAVEALAARIRAGERLTVALEHAARELADPTADLVIAALMTAARAQAHQLTELLAALATTAREDAAGRMRAAVARARVRTSVRVVVGSTVGLAVVLAAWSSDYLAPYGTVEGQVVLAAVGGLFAVAFTWLARIGRPQAAPRLLGDGAVP
ncbi:type II secretion system F family protein [Pseudonocardia sp.]|uniref:type II secretion system F family protein n=1 Tax=Pseudonocardia sp. TaxID=60912 RepID=UPI003D10DFE9